MIKKQELLTDLPNQIKKFETLCQTSIKKNLSNTNNENSIGDYLFESKNLRNCYDLSWSEDCAYTYMGFETKDLMDICGTSKGILGYEGTSFGYDAYHGIGVCGMRTCNSCMYSFDIHHSSNLFGCACLRDKQYCILNKQYSKSEYETLVPKIIEHMIKTGEWGEFFPAWVSPFGYNETVAMEYFPLRKDEAIKQGFKRSDYEAPFPKTETKDVIICEVTGKPFKMTKPELEFYRKHNLPPPRRHPDQRHYDRMALRNPRKLRDRKCDKCGVIMKTTYSPERDEIVYCEACYNKEIYG